MVVYRITNRVNGKQYVGQTVSSIKRRFTAHCNVKSGTMCPIKAAIQKHGKDNFSYIILSECSSIEELNETEIYWIDHYQTIAPDGYNILTGGKNGLHTETSKNKMSKARKGIQKPNKGCFPSKPVICIETNITYPSVNNCAVKMKLQHSNIGKVLKGIRKHTGGYTFKNVT